MVNGFRYYRALESISIASALSTALTIYPCQIRVHERWQSKLQLPTARKKEWRPATAGSSPPGGYLSTLCTGEKLATYTVAAANQYGRPQMYVSRTRTSIFSCSCKVFWDALSTSHNKAAGLWLVSHQSRSALCLSAMLVASPVRHWM